MDLDAPIVKTVSTLNSWQREILCRYLGLPHLCYTPTDRAIKQAAKSIKFHRGEADLDRRLGLVSYKLRYTLEITDIKELC
jgi:hypothetical protein